MTWIIILIILVILGGIFIALYNNLVKLRQRVQNAWAQVDVQLKRRYDLIPNLVNTVKGYATHEQGTFEKITHIRNINRHPYEFYQKVGYQIVGVIPNANGLGKPDIIMAKSLI